MALRIARPMGPHTFAEDFPLPAPRDIVQVMIRNMTLNQTKGLWWYFLWEIHTLEELHRIFQIYLSHSTHSQLKMFPRKQKMTSMKLLEMQGELISLQCQWQDSGSVTTVTPVLSETLLHSFHFQQCIFVEQGFPVCWLSRLHAEIDLSQEMILAVLSCKDCWAISDSVRKKQPLPSHRCWMFMHTVDNAVCVVYCCHIKTVTYTTPCFRTKFHLFVIWNKYSMI